MTAEKVYLLANTQPLAYGNFWCWSCRMMRSDPFLCPLGFVCGSCHRVLVGYTTVKVDYSADFRRIEFTWAGIGGARINRAADDRWILESKIPGKSHPNWWSAAYAWAVSAGYKGPNPFSRNDWCYYINPPEPEPEPETLELTEVTPA